MSLDEAKTGVTMGLPFGSLYPMLDELERDDFRRWFGARVRAWTGEPRRRSR